MNVIPVLAGLIEDARKIWVCIGERNDLLQALALQVGGLIHEPVQGRDIGLVVLVMMQLQRFLAHATICERGFGEIQGGKFECHG